MHIYVAKLGIYSAPLNLWILLEENSEYLLLIAMSGKETKPLHAWVLVHSKYNTSSSAIIRCTAEICAVSRRQLYSKMKLLPHLFTVFWCRVRRKYELFLLQGKKKSRGTEQTWSLQEWEGGWLEMEQGSFPVTKKTQGSSVLCVGIWPHVNLYILQWCPLLTCNSNAACKTYVHYKVLRAGFFHPDI